MFGISRLPRFASLLLVTGFSASAHTAYAYFLNTFITGPATATMGSAVPLNFGFTLDLVGAPVELVAYGAGVSARVSFGNGKDAVVSFSTGGLPGQVITTNNPLSTSYPVPGRYTVGASWNIIDTLTCTYGPCGVVSRGPFPTFPTSITVGKSAEYVASHLAIAKDAEVSLATLSLFGSLSAMGSTGDAVSSFLQTVLDETGTNWGTVLSVLLATIGGGLVGGPTGLAIGSVYALMSAYYTVTQATETKLANDPPDSNYQAIYQYSSPLMTLDFGLGPNVNTYFQTGLSDISALLESIQGQLTAMERAQGALAAGDMTAFAAQIAALDGFRADYSTLAPDAGRWIASLPTFLSSHEFDTNVPYTELAYNTFLQTAAQLGVAPTAVPEPGTLPLIAIAVFWLSWFRRQRLLISTYFATLRRKSLSRCRRWFVPSGGSRGLT